MTRAQQVARKLGRTLTPREAQLAEQYGPSRFGAPPSERARTASLSKPRSKYLTPRYVGAHPRPKVELPYTTEELYVSCFDAPEVEVEVTTPPSLRRIATLDDPERSCGRWVDAPAFEWGVAIPPVLDGFGLNKR